MGGRGWGYRVTRYICLPPGGRLTYHTLTRLRDFFFLLLLLLSEGSICKMNCASAQLEKRPQMLPASGSRFHLHSNTRFHFQARVRLLALPLRRSATAHLHHCHLLDLTSHSTVSIRFVLANRRSQMRLVNQGLFFPFHQRLSALYNCVKVSRGGIQGTRATQRRPIIHKQPLICV